MVSFCGLFNEFATKANELSSLEKEIEGIALPIVKKAIDGWNGFKNDWKIIDYSLTINKKGMVLALLAFENAGRYPIKPFPCEITEEEISVIKDFISKIFFDDIPDFAPFRVVAS